MFDDRKDAGQQLAQALETYRDRHPLILAIPRGGVEVGYQVARHLNAEFSLLITRKLPFPTNPESGFGAIAEDGSTFIYPTAAARIPREEIERIVTYQKEEIERRIEVLRSGKELPNLNNRVVILVDDGIAMGSTMRASIRLCQNQKAGHVVVAVPVAGERSIRDIKPLVDDMVVLESPPYFRAVAQVYRHWRDVSDQEVLKIMEKWRER